MKYIDVSDFLLVPLYGILLYFIIRPLYNRYREQGEGLQGFFITTFLLHILGSVLYAMVIQYYYKSGDSFGFFSGSRFIYHMTTEEMTLKYFFYGPDQLSDLFFTTDAANEIAEKVVGSVMNNSSNLIIMKISAALSFLSFNRYLIVSIFFGFLSFIGSWKLFLTMNDVLQGKAKKLLAITVLYTPSMWFWGSGLIKDSVCMACLGIIVSALYNAFVKKKPGIRELIFAVLCFLVLLTVKSYIAVALLVAAVIFGVSFFISGLKNRFAKAASLAFILLTGALVFNFFLAPFVNGIIEDTLTTIDSFKNVYETMEADGTSGSGFMGKNLDFTVTGIILNSPAAILTTLFRPFLWEIRNLMMVFSSIESFLCLASFLYLLFKLRFFRFFSSLFASPFTIFALLFVLILSLIIGFTTFNFGTMVRYRIPVLPFYAFMLISVYVRYVEQKTQPVKTS